MCGIGGIVYFDGRRPDEAQLRRIGHAMRHRGPDDEGTFIHESFGMVHRRLSIIDLDTGHQPIFNETRSVVTILNGEIYNYRALRRDLESKGHRFSTDSDTEVLVHLYEDHGDLGFLGQLNGMFAFLIYDLERRVLWLARDRAGKKPIYYYRDERQFAFASELQALRELSGLTFSLSPRAVDSFLRYNYVPGPLSIHREVRKMPAAHALKVDGDRIDTSPYWQMPAPEPDETMSDDDFHDRFRERLRQAVRSRLIADVPLGAFLSGGLDSTAIVTLMSEQARGPVSTFSIGFGRGSFDESRESSAIAAALGTDHRVETHERIDVGDIDGIFAHFGEPFGDSSAIPTYYLCETARRHVTVALSGDGADEVLAGYNRYVASQFASHWQRLPRALRPRWPLRWIASLPEGKGYYGDSFVKKLKLLSRFVDRLEMDPRNIVPIVLDDEARAALYSPDFRSVLAANSEDDAVLACVRQYAQLDLTERMLWTDFHTYLIDDINVKVDRMSMAHGLEVRCPFLDVDLMEFLATVPLRLKIRRGKTKRLLRALVAERFPETAKRRKHGFEAPIGEWIKTDLRERLDELFSGDAAGVFFDRKRLRGLLDAHRNRKIDLSKPIWAIFALLQWAESQQRARSLGF
jgi:asparagine synthase (glutamine-hydrolysing)